MRRQRERRRAGRERGVRALVRAVAGRMHRDDRGAISVLVLLMIWCLVALIAMIWNTAEEATRKQQLQTAADSMAHAGATIMARALNETAAQNMIICQDASAEVIYDAIEPTKTAIGTRLNDELTHIAAEDINTDAIRQQLQQRLDNVYRSYGPVIQQLDTLDANATVGITDPKEVTRRKNEIRRARSVVGWMHDTYVGGMTPPNRPPAPVRPGPPTFNNYSGLAAIVEHLNPKEPDAVILKRIEQFINERELPVLDDFKSRTNGVMSRSVPGMMQSHRAAVFEQQQEVRAQAVAEIDRQQEQFATYYKAELAHFVLRNDDPRDASPLTFKPALLTGAEVPWTWNGYTESIHHDSIRPQFPPETIAEFGFPYYDFAIDPINPQTGAERIWHPIVPVSFTAAGAGIKIDLRCEPYSPLPKMGWGFSYATPIERYFYDRVEADQAVLNNRPYMVELDVRRSVELAEIIQELMGLPNTRNIPGLPQTILDDAPDPEIQDPPVYAQLGVPYVLQPPAGAIDAYRGYNIAAGRYRIAIYQLWRAIRTYMDAYSYFTSPFASGAWYGNVSAQRFSMLKAMGQDRQFMVLRTYELRYVPDWASSSVYNSVFNAVLNEIVEMNLAAAMKQAVDFLVAIDLDGQRPYLDEDELHAYYYQRALGPVRAGLRGVATAPAQRIANEWLSRPWPYEISAPAEAPPPVMGLLKSDRQRYFTVVAAAREAEGTQPREIMQWIFTPQNNKMVAVAQAEAFNWMELNSGYGAADRFDQITTVPWAGRWSRYTHFVGSPRSWRDATVGGWNWRSRLTLGDAMYQTVQDNVGNNPSLQDYLNSAGISTSDQASFNELQLH